MRAWLCATIILLQGSLVAQTAQQASDPAPTTTATNGDSDAKALLKVKRMVVSSLVATKRFKVTENRDHADATLKGVALEKTSQEVHAYGESTAVGSASGGSHGEVSGSMVNGTGSISGSSSGGFIARHMGTSDSSLNTETINEARVAVRLVNADGDVIWTTTQESRGAKYKGSSADVADKCVKQLLRDLDKLGGGNQPTSSAPTVSAPPQSN